jgi:hypothetical protein
MSAATYRIKTVLRACMLVQFLFNVVNIQHVHSDVNVTVTVNVSQSASKTLVHRKHRNRHLQKLF